MECNMATDVRLSEIRCDGGTQSRASICCEAIREYAEVYRSGGKMPPVVLFHDSQVLWLADGFARVAAAKQAGRASINAEIKHGTRRDAILFSVACNASHGVRRTTADKIAAVKLILADEEWRGRSDRWIAEHCNVSNHFVASVRKSIGSAPNAADARQTSDGRTYPARRQPASDQPDPDSTGPEREPGDDTESEAEAEAAGKPRKVGAQLFDWKAFDKHFGPVARGPDGIASAFKGEKKSEEYRTCVRALEEFAKSWKAWHKRLTCKRKEK